MGLGGGQGPRSWGWWLTAWWGEQRGQFRELQGSGWWGSGAGQEREAQAHSFGGGAYMSGSAGGAQTGTRCSRRALGRTSRTLPTQGDATRGEQERWWWCEGWPSGLPPPLPPSLPCGLERCAPPCPYCPPPSLSWAPYPLIATGPRMARTADGICLLPCLACPPAGPARFLQTCQLKLGATHPYTGVTKKNLEACNAKLSAAK